MQYWVQLAWAGCRSILGDHLSSEPTVSAFEWRSDLMDTRRVLVRYMFDWWKRDHLIEQSFIYLRLPFMMEHHRNHCSSICVFRVLLQFSTHQFNAELSELYNLILWTHSSPTSRPFHLMRLSSRIVLAVRRPFTVASKAIYVFVCRINYTTMDSTLRPGATIFAS